MPRIHILGASLIVFAAGICAAAAADVPVYTPPPAETVYSPTSAYNWTGAYVGLQGGYNWGSATVGPAPTASVAADGFSGGLFAGYNFQTGGNFVLGAEADIFLNGQKGTGGGFTVSNPWGASLRARAGYAIDRFLIYGTGGLALGSVTSANAASSDTGFKTGWTLGAGIEAAITDTITGRIEYRYTDLGTATLATTPASTVDLKTHAVMLGVGMKF